MTGAEKNLSEMNTRYQLRYFAVRRLLESLYKQVVAEFGTAIPDGPLSMITGGTKAILQHCHYAETSGECRITRLEAEVATLRGALSYYARKPDGEMAQVVLDSGAGREEYDVLEAAAVWALYFAEHASVMNHPAETALFRAVTDLDVKGYGLGVQTEKSDREAD